MQIDRERLAPSNDLRRFTSSVTVTDASLHTLYSNLHIIWSPLNASAPNYCEIQHVCLATTILSLASVGISTLLGSIMTRNRLLPLRIMTPPTFLIASTAYFLPKHFTNTTTYITALEKTYTPELYSWQSQCLSTLYRVRKSALEIVGRGTQETQDASSRVWRWVYAQAGAGQKQRSQSQSDIDR